MQPHLPMHLHLELYLEEEPNDESILEALSPFKYDDNDGIWDWFIVGARWKGVHVEDYDQLTDTSNREACDVCHGNEDQVCHRCQGHGEIMKWPTDFPAHPFDICKLSDVKQGLTSVYLVVDGDLYRQKKWEGLNIVDGNFDGKVMPKLKELDKKEGWLVTIDVR